MKLFWQHGYEATSLADLVEATGAKAPTLYAEFTNKEGVISCRSRPLYRSFLPLSMKHSCFVKRKSVESALADYFAAIANCFTSKDTPAGCFMINNCTTLSPDSGDIANTLKSRHAMQERTLQQFLCQRQARGEIPPHCDVTHLAEFLNCIIQGDVDQRTRRCIAGKTDADCRNDFAFMARTGEISRKKKPLSLSE